jgi:3',5'-cyclic AMP phosphodiesterase CpdA
VNKDGNFKIMQLTDLHFGESLEADRLTMRAITAWVNKEKPDFVAVTGDLVSGFIWDH